jgi:predicted MFS family arabinose efflux permease
VPTYTSLFRLREFRTLWTTTVLGVASSTMFSLALATLVYDRTGSALLSALALFGPMLAQVGGATTLMSLADVARPRVTLTVLAAVVAVAHLIQAALDLPVLVRVLIVLAVAYVLSIGSGVRWGLLHDVLPPGTYALGRSAMNLAVGSMQVLGFAVGGILLQVLDVREIFLVGAVLMTLAVPLTWLGLREHQPRRWGRAGLRETWRGNRLLLHQPSTRPLLLALCVPNGLVVGCEALFVPYAGNQAAWLFGAGAAGMFAGDLVVGRWLSREARLRAATWLRLLLAVPFLAFVLHPPVMLAAALVLVACVGYAASLAQQEMLVALTPRELSGQVLGVESSARMTFQGVGALLAGGLADVLDVGLTMTLLATASLLVSLVLTRPLTAAARRTVVHAPATAT